MGPSDAELVQRCLAGDNAGFDLLVRKYQRQVHGLCYRMLGDADEAADAAQESFIKAYHALESFRQDAQFLTWVTRIARNACLDSVRRRAVRQADSIDDDESGAGSLPSGAPSPEEAALRSDAKRRLDAAILDLPESHRAALVMFHFSGLTISEISRALGRPEGTVKSDLHHARERLRRRLEGVEVSL